MVSLRHARHHHATIAAKCTAALYVGAAENDRQHTPEVTSKLAQALQGHDAIIATSPGTSHGFCVPDTPVYDEAQAEKHWGRLLALYARRLA